MTRPISRPITRPTVRHVPVLSALLALLVALGVVAGIPSPASAGTVAKSRCDGHDSGIKQGFCFADDRGAVYWLGTLKGYDGVEMYCIDYLFATKWGIAHRRIVVNGALPTSTGGSVGAATVAALNQLVTEHPAAGAGDTTAAAIGLVIRQVMGDVHGSSTRRGIPGGLTVAGKVRDVGFVSDAVVRRARTLWDEAVAHRGPWKLAVAVDPGADKKVTAGERVTATVRGSSGAGKAQDMTVALTYRGFTGPASVRLGTDGVATVTLTAPKTPGAASVSGKVAGAPGTQPVLLRPNQWSVNPRPGNVSAYSQRGLVGRQDTVQATAAVTATIVKSKPTLVTRASAQQVEPGAKIHDTVTVSGTGGAAGSFDWSLLGPVAPVGERCPGTGDAAWKTAPVIAAGTVPTSGDGTYVTTEHVVRPADVGCLTYVESRPATTTTEPVSTPPGIAEETVLATRPKAEPCLSTTTSQQRGQVGVRLRDRVRVGCLDRSDRITVVWTLHGPLAPRAGVTGKAACDQISAARWAEAPVAARGTFTASGSGVVSTAPFTVRKPGCYTYSESAAATGTTRAARTVPGIAVETSLVTRPRISPVPTVPTGPDASRYAAPRPTSVKPRPGTLRVPALGVAVAVDPVGVRASAMTIPADTSRVGWLRSSAAAGDVIGASVLAGHVADQQDRHGELAVLVRAKPGHEVVWVDASGVRHRFVITSVAKHPRGRPLPASVFRNDGPHVLRLITCTTRITTAGGGFHYADNLVVTARAVA